MKQWFPSTIYIIIQDAARLVWLAIQRKLTYTRMKKHFVVCRGKTMYMAVLPVLIFASVFLKLRSFPVQRAPSNLNFADLGKLLDF